ncbi:Serine/threonine-protein phosphatase 7 long form [Glycine max]|nr:Serine/threonine-protein phosphatase 7 long form [Glycine max]
MASSSSCLSNISINSGPVEGDVEEDRKLHVRRVVPTYQGQEEIPEEIIPLLCQSDFYWIMKMRYLKISAAVITALIERWRPETHTFHMRCGECTITLQDVSVLLGLCVDGSPLIGPTNLSWADLCEELLRVRSEEGELQGNMIKLSWLTHHFSNLNNYGGVLFVDKSSNKVSVRYLQFLRDFRECNTYSWGPAVLGYLYREMCSATDYRTKSIGGDCDGEINILEPYSATVMLALPPICLVGIIEWHQPDKVLRQFGMQQPIPSSPSQPFNIHGISLREKHEENWGQLVDAYPRQEGLLSFNSDYMVWYRRKTKMFVDPKNANMAALVEVAETLQYMVSPQGRNTWTVDDLMPYVEKITILFEEQERMTEPLSHEREFPTQQLNIRQSSVETKGIDRQRETVEAEPYLYTQMAERGHGMYYTPPIFSQYPYPFEAHQSDTSASEHSLGDMRIFSWPTMTPTQQHDVPIETPNAPLGTQWNVPGAIPNMDELLGVDLRHQFSLEADQHEEGGHRGRRNPDR